MRIALGLLLAAAAAAAACGKSSSSHGGAGSGAGTGAAPANAEEPTTPAPPPTVKVGGVGDCKTNYAPHPTRDPNPMCKVAGGMFTMGRDNERMDAKVSPYYIDQFEVTNAQVVHFMNATKGRHACGNSPVREDACLDIGAFSPSSKRYIKKQGDQFVVDPQYARFPFVHALRNGASLYCAWAGKKLPTEAQWEFAAAYDEGTKKHRLYPWGDEFDPTRVRCESCVSIGADKYAPAAVGTFDGTNDLGDGRSPWGAFDMAGNASEYTLGCFAPYHQCDGGPCVDPQGEPAPAKQPCEPVARGGASFDDAATLTTSYRNNHPQAGFRCAR